MPLTVPNNPWQSLRIPDNPWQSLTIHDNPWQWGESRHKPLVNWRGRQVPGSSLVKASCRRRVFLSSGTKFPSHKTCLVSHWMDLCFHDSALSSLSVFHSVVVAALFARTLPFFLFFSGSQSASLLPRPTLKCILVSLCEEFKWELLAICFEI